MEENYSFVSPDLLTDYRERIAGLSETVWPEFMLHDPVAGLHWDGLFENFAKFQFALLSREGGTVAGIANSVPFFWDLPLEALPDEGWDWALQQSAADQAQGIRPNTLCGIQISIAPGFQGKGLSKVLLGQMLKLARAADLSRVVVPVRPSLKASYPLAPIERYIGWQNAAGLPFDPWLRVHVRSGGKIVKACPRAMRIPGTIAEWEAWTGMRFFESGDHIIPGALTPVKINIEQDLGLYLEPNVWVVHAALES